MKKRQAIQQQIGVRELMRDTKRILEAAQKGRSFIVSIHGKPAARIVPMESPTKYSYQDFLELAGKAKSKETDLSQRVDEIVYGI